MKVFMTGLMLLLAGCDLTQHDTKLAKTENTFFANGSRYEIVCIENVQYFQSYNNGNLTPKYDVATGLPRKC